MLGHRSDLANDIYSRYPARFCKAEPHGRLLRPRGCDQFFGGRFARRMAARYRKRGLDKTARRMVGFLEAAGIAGATVLEIGGGVGEIEIELLKRGARARQPRALACVRRRGAAAAGEADLEGKAERRLHDIAVDPEGVEPADVVVLHRVVCCYPDYERLLSAAAGRARRLLVFSYPRRNAVSRARRSRCRTPASGSSRKRVPHVRHPPSRCSRCCEAGGLDPRSRTAGSPGRSPGSSAERALVRGQRRGDPVDRRPGRAPGSMWCAASDSW